MHISIKPLIQPVFLYLLNIQGHAQMSGTGVCTYMTECTYKTIGMYTQIHTHVHTHRCGVIRGLAGFAGLCAFPLSWMVSILVCECVCV